MSWFDKLIPSRIQTSDKKQVPDGLWSKCKACEATIYTAELVANQSVCPKCGHHMEISARQRLTALFDKDSMVEIAATMKSVDKLKFKDLKTYKDRVKAGQKSTDENDALIAFSGELYARPLVAAAFEYRFMGGSMGSVVGEKFVRSVETAIELNAPLVCFAASGGARMQEGLISLMQMAKTSAALTRLSEKKLPFISVLTDPTMGGVSASFAMLGDLIFAEPKARIGFAGKRVIEQTVRETLPEDFQTSEFLLEKGAIDQIVDRREMRDCLGNILSMLQRQPSIASDAAVTSAIASSGTEVEAEADAETTVETTTETTAESAAESTAKTIDNAQENPAQEDGKKTTVDAEPDDKLEVNDANSESTDEVTQKASTETKND